MTHLLLRPFPPPQVRWFKHNDVEDLKRVLEEVKRADAAVRKPLNRRFIVVEGVYSNYGERERAPLLQWRRVRLCTPGVLALAEALLPRACRAPHPAPVTTAGAERMEAPLCSPPALPPQGTSLR